jgi:hypothetical protein
VFPSLHDLVDETSNQAVSQQMFTNQLLGIGLVDSAIPDSIWIDRDGRSFSAASHTERSRDPDIPAASRSLDEAPKHREETYTPASRAVGVHTDEHVLRERAVRVDVGHRLGVCKLVSQAPEHRAKTAYVRFRARERKSILAVVARQWRPTVERFFHSFVDEAEKTLVASQVRCELRSDPGIAEPKLVHLLRQLSDEAPREKKVGRDDDPFRAGARHELKGIRKQGLRDSHKARNHPVKRPSLGRKSDDLAEVPIRIRVARSASHHDKGGLRRMGGVSRRGSRTFDEESDETWVNPQRACRLESDAGEVASSLCQRERHVILDVPSGEKEER